MLLSWMLSGQENVRTTCNVLVSSLLGTCAQKMGVCIRLVSFPFCVYLCTNIVEPATGNKHIKKVSHKCSS